MRIKFIFLLFFSVLTLQLLADKVTIPIETKNNAIVLQTDNDNHLKIIHTGKPLKNKDEYELSSALCNFNMQGAIHNNNAFTFAGTDNNFVEPSLAVVHADGNNSIDLKYENHTTTVDSNDAILTTITLKDPVYPFFIDLHYKAWFNEDVIEQWTTIRHHEEGEVILNKYASANLYLSSKDYYLTSYNAAHIREMQPVVTHLQQGMHTIQTRLGSRQNLHTHPNFMLSLDGKATETTGTVMIGQIAWNGNFSIEFEIDVYKNMHIVAGINPYQSVYHLKPNTSFETPHFIYTISYEGTGKASRNLHKWIRDNTLKNGKENRLTLLNNWEATFFDFDQDKLVGLFEGAKDLGVDLFLLDDGWFGNKYPRNNDKAGLGDWEVNTEKLPDGIPYLVKEAEKKGLKFGIWIEAEMVNPKSELYEKHPDWVIRQEKRPEILFRNQLVLDLTNPDVQDYIFSIVDSLFIENPTLAYIKWDCNAPIFNGHSKYLEKKNIPQSHLYVEYTKGFDNVLKRVTAKYPAIPMMLCSGGGARSDYSLLQHFTEFWLSDNTEPLERVFLQWDNSYYYPAIAMCSHVTKWGDKPLKYRMDVASMGKLGFDIRADELSEKDMKFCQEAIKNYNGYKNIVWHGEMYRLASPHDNDYASLVYVNQEKTEAILFNYLANWRYTGNPSLKTVKLQGLDKNKKYKLQEINLYDNQKTSINDKIYSGDFLMNIGFNPQVNFQRASVVIKLEAI